MVPTLLAFGVMVVGEWSPQIEYHSLHKGERLEWQEAVRAERERSLAVFKERGEAALQDLLHGHVKRDRVVIVENRIYCHKTFVEQSIKNRMHLALLTSMQRMGFRLPNVVYLHTTSATGRSVKLQNRSLPTTMISKREGFGNKGILVPNPFFGGGDLLAWKDQCLTLESGPAFLERRPQVFWRGSVDNHKGDCDRDAGNYARLAAIALTVRRPDLFNVKATQVFQPRNTTTFPCSAMPYDGTMASMSHRHHLLDKHHHSKNKHSHYDDRWWKPENYSEFAFVLNLPGKTSGSYSRNLNHLWALGSVVFLWNSPVVEWYYPALETSKTHVAINYTNAIDAVAHLVEDVALQRRLARAALQVHRTFLCKCSPRFGFDSLLSRCGLFGS